MTLNFRFGGAVSSVHTGSDIPKLERITSDGGVPQGKCLVVCDEHTAVIAGIICGNTPTPRCVLQSGENAKGWPAVETILRTAKEAGLGRDGLFIGVGGGVIGDLCAFAASIYMRGCNLALVCTTLLGMLDAGVGGKTGFDLFGVKNLAGSFYPARHIYMPMQSLASLPEKEFRSGFAELVKTAILAGDAFLDEIARNVPPDPKKFERLGPDIVRAVKYKGRIVHRDPRETGGKRFLLNLGHTFGHALEASAGLGNISHGEAVAWGIVRSCELGLALGITPAARAEKIQNLVAACGYETKTPHPLAGSPETFFAALNSDKKKRAGKLVFIVPDKKSARPVVIDSESDMGKITHIINNL